MKNEVYDHHAAIYFLLQDKYNRTKMSKEQLQRQQQQQQQVQQQQQQQQQQQPTSPSRHLSIGGGEGETEQVYTLESLLICTITRTGIYDFLMYSLRSVAVPLPSPNRPCPTFPSSKLNSSSSDLRPFGSLNSLNPSESSHQTTASHLLLLRRGCRQLSTGA